MPQHPNKISQFWQELKRRKVFRVVAMYAATAFILLEVVDIVAPALLLPSWTVTIVVVLLAIGFPIAIILSWIFDLTPEGVKKTESIEIAKEQEQSSAPVRRKLRVSDAIIVVLIVVVGILVYPKIFKKDKFKNIRDADGKISVAVMPFQNMTGDTTLNWFQRGVSSLIINGLGNSSELTVHDDHTMFEVMNSMDQVFTAGISLSLAGEVAEKVRSETYISGSFQGRDGKYRILLNLVDTKSGDVTWTSKVEGDLKSSEYLDLSDSLCIQLKNYLEIKVLEKEADYDFRKAYTESAEAYRYYIKGMNLILTMDYPSGIQHLKEAFEIDSTFSFASFFIAFAYNYSLQYEQSYLWIQRAYCLKDRLPSKYQYWLNLWYAFTVSKNLQDIIRYSTLLEESGIESPLLWNDLGSCYLGIQLYEKAVESFKKFEEICQERHKDLIYEPDFIIMYGIALHKVGKHKEEKELIEEGLINHPNNISIIRHQAICAISRKDSIQTNEYSDKYFSLLEEQSIRQQSVFSEHLKYVQLGRLYDDAKDLVKAEQYYRKALKLKPDYTLAMHYLAANLFEQNINIYEGMELINKVLEAFPDRRISLWTKGEGLYQQGNYQEALDIFETLWKSILTYNHYSYLSIQKTEQALANQNSEQ